MFGTRSDASGDTCSGYPIRLRLYRSQNLELVVWDAMLLIEVVTLA